MPVVFGGITPHPPIIIPEVGGSHLQEVEKTVDAMKQLAADLQDVQPDVVVMVSPHAPALREGVGIFTQLELSGNLASFGVPEISLNLHNDLELTKVILAAAREKGYTMLELKRSLGSTLDHGAIVPLYYLMYKKPTPMVLLSLGLLPREDLYAFGKVLQEIFAASEKRVAFIASGDLSHRLTPEAPAGFDPQGKVFDAQIVEAIAKWYPDEIVNMNHLLIQKAGECGLRPIIMLLGVFADMITKSSILSYEGPFGVGYMVAKVEVGD